MLCRKHTYKVLLKNGEKQYFLKITKMPILEFLTPCTRKMCRFHDKGANLDEKSIQLICVKTRSKGSSDVNQAAGVTDYKYITRKCGPITKGKGNRDGPQSKNVCTYI